MANKATSKSQEAYYARYKSKYSQNRERKLRRALKRNPNNIQIETALKNVSYRRHTPKTRVWSKSAISTAMLMKSFTGKFDKGIFSTDPKVSQAACATRNPNIFLSLKDMVVGPMNAKRPFSIGARAHNPNGQVVWG